MEAAYSSDVIAKISEEFSRTADICYLDHAGATLYSEKQIKNVAEDLCKNVYGNPHTHSSASKHCTASIEQVRLRVLQFFNTNPQEYSVIFTSNATAAIKTLVETFDFGLKPGNYVYTQSCHTSVVGAREIKQVPSYCVPVEDFDKLFDDANQNSSLNGNSLFVYPAQSNFSGQKFPLSWIEKIQNGGLNNYLLKKGLGPSNWYCLLDAACYGATNHLDLSKYKPDFACLSFYKIFGYPTGLGALLVKNTSAGLLKKNYFGGGTVEISLVNKDFHVKRPVLWERFEDGTLSYLSIISLDHGFDTLKRLELDMETISRHVFYLAKQTATRMESLRHWNGAPVVQIYSKGTYESLDTQGGIVSFNLRRSDGRYVGYVEVQHVADIRKIQLRTGCFCNSGSCQYYLALSDQDLLQHFKAGHVCGDERDLIDEQPTGAVRVSFGYMSTQQHVDKLMEMIETFVEKTSRAGKTGRCSRGDSEQEIIKLNQICLYPVKSCGALRVDNWKLNEKGLEYDREWMIVNRNGICLTQKQESKLCLIRPEIDLPQGVLTLKMLGDLETVTLPLKHDHGKLKTFESDLCQTKICKDYVKSYDCGDRVSRWLCRVLNIEGLRLVRQIQDDDRTTRYKNRVEENMKLSLANQAQYLLINVASVRWLQGEAGLEDVFDLDNMVSRFRANFIIETKTEFSENNWKNIKIGNVTFRVDGPCTRCQMICIDQTTGFTSQEPLQTLSSALSGRIKFGIYLTRTDHQHQQTISTTDDVEFVQQS